MNTGGTQMDEPATGSNVLAGNVSPNGAVGVGMCVR